MAKSGAKAQLAEEGRTGMDTVQCELKAGNKGQELTQERSEPKETDLVKGIVHRLVRTISDEGMDSSEGTRPYPEEALDLPGLDVPDREE